MPSKEQELIIRDFVSGRINSQQLSVSESYIPELV